MNLSSSCTSVSPFPLNLLCLLDLDHKLDLPPLAVTPNTAPSRGLEARRTGHCSRQKHARRLLLRQSRLRGSLRRASAGIDETDVLPGCSFAQRGEVDMKGGWHAGASIGSQSGSMRGYMPCSFCLCVRALAGAGDRPRGRWRFAGWWLGSALCHASLWKRWCGVASAAGDLRHCPTRGARNAAWRSRDARARW
ncbi:hypothetical protein B0H14DRAFT_1453887 [Mycena olivaceomarginata]|nr:hypothetical protein B0H14DRAFT_1453887 [Mycena olivaceomarginata]